MKGQEQIFNHFSEVFRALETTQRGHSGQEWNTFRKAAFQALLKTDFPDRKHEDWKYTPVAKLTSPPYLLAKPGNVPGVAPISDFAPYVLRIINGWLDTTQLDPSLAEKNIRVIPIQEAMSLPEFRSSFEALLTTQSSNGNKAFDYLNFAFHVHAFYIDIPPKLVLDKPIEIDFIHQDASVSFSHPLYFIRFGAESQVTVFERFEGTLADSDLPAEGLINSIGYFHLEKGARIQHIKWQNLPSPHHLVYKRMIAQKRDSYFQTLAFDYGGQIVRNTVEVELEESNTYTSLQAGFIARGKQSMDHQTRINHLVPHGESHELYKGIIDDQANGAFNGKVYVHPDAQKTNAFQQNDTLVLSSNAVMNSKPQLEIFADDVKCSHGATIGQLDQRALFYLQSRGLDQLSATYMLKSAFLAVVLDQVSVDPIRDYIASQMGMKP